MIYPKELFAILTIFLVTACHKDKSRLEEIPVPEPAETIRPLKSQKEFRYTDLGACYFIVQNDYTYTNGVPTRIDYTILSISGTDTVVNKNAYCDLMYYDASGKIVKNEFRTRIENKEALTSTSNYDYGNDNRLKYKLFLVPYDSFVDTLIYNYDNNLTTAFHSRFDNERRYFTTDIDSVILIDRTFVPEKFTRTFFTYNLKEDLAFKYLRKYLPVFDNLSHFELVNKNESSTQNSTSEDYLYTRTYDSQKYPIEIKIWNKSIIKTRMEYTYW